MNNIGNERAAVAIVLAPILFCVCNNNLQSQSDMFAKAVKQATRSVVKVSDFSVASRKFATYKSSTGLVGLAVDPNGRETLQALSAEVLASVKVMS